MAAQTHSLISFPLEEQQGKGRRLPQSRTEACGYSMVTAATGKALRWHRWRSHPTDSVDYAKEVGFSSHSVFLKMNFIF